MDIANHKFTLSVVADRDNMADCLQNLWWVLSFSWDNRENLSKETTEYLMDIVAHTHQLAKVMGNMDIVENLEETYSNLAEWNNTLSY